MEDIIRVFRTQATTPSKKYYHIFTREHPSEGWNHEISVDTKEDRDAEVDSHKAHRKASNVKSIRSDRSPEDHLKELNSKRVEASSKAPRYDRKKLEESKSYLDKAKALHKKIADHADAAVLKEHGGDISKAKLSHLSSRFAHHYNSHPDKPKMDRLKKKADSIDAIIPTKKRKKVEATAKPARFNSKKALEEYHSLKKDNKSRYDRMVDHAHSSLAKNNRKEYEEAHGSHLNDLITREVRKHPEYDEHRKVSKRLNTLGEELLKRKKI